MSFSTIKITGAKENLVVNVPSVGEAVGANATPEHNVSGAGSDNEHILYAAMVDCSDNPNEDVTLRLYNVRSGVTVGTTVAHVFVPGIRGRIVEYEWPIGIRFSAGISVAVVKGIGGTGGSDNPSGKVLVALRMSD